jgi:hypothetical protein
VICADAISGGQIIRKMLNITSFDAYSLDARCAGGKA